MLVYRIARAAYPVLDGEGARRYGGRWNSPGLPVVYAAGSRALAILEVLVWTDPRNVPADLTLFEIEVPGHASSEQVPASALPADWRGPGHPACSAAGDAWAQANRSLVLAVPSAIVPAEWNYLLNPRHPEIASVRVTGSSPFEFDPRLLL